MKNSFKVILGIVVLGVLIVLIFAFSRKDVATPQVSPSTKAVGTTNVKPLTIDDLETAQVPDFNSDADSPKMVTLVAGNYSSANIIQGSHDVIDTQSDIDLDTDPTSYASADLNGDNASDIVGVIGASGGGSGYFVNLVVFLNDNGKPKYADSILLGDRVKVNKVTVVSNVLITVDIITQGPNEPLCCGTLRKSLQFGFVKGKLTEMVRK